MKKYIIIIMALMATQLQAMDLFSVYDSKAPTACIDVDSTKQLTLADLTQIAVCNNPSLSAEYMLLKSKEAALGTAKSGYLPTLKVVAEGYYDKTKVEDSESIANEPYYAKASVSWLIYDFGGRYSSIGQSKALLSATNHSYNAAFQTLLLDVTNAYLKVLGAKESLKSYEASRESYKKAFEMSSKRYELGMVSLVDKLQAKTSYEQSELSVVKAENSLKQAEGNLAILLNLNPSTNLNLIEIPTEYDIVKLEGDKDIENLMKDALENRPEIKAQESSSLAYEKAITNVRSGYFPSISAEASGYYGDNWRHSNPYNTEGTVGLKLDWPIFSGMKTSYQVDQAKYVYEQSLKNLESSRTAILNEVWSYYQNYQTAVKAYDISKQILETAQENSRVAFRYYELGKSDILNLLTANARLADAEQGLVNAFYALLMSKANLYRAIGRMDNGKVI